MRESIPLPGSTRAKLITAGLAHFSLSDYNAVEVDAVAADAGVTVGALYHHFESKLAFYGVLRDEMTRRLLDRMEAAAEAVPRGVAYKAAMLAAFDGTVRLNVGKLITEPDPRKLEDELAHFLDELARQGKRAGEGVLGHILAAALRAALTQSGDIPKQHAIARGALEHFLR
jgi:AcrR family transcriptional regulator